MAGTVNKVILIGHLGDEVKMHFFEGGNAIGRFPLATNETYTNRQTGERITNTEWHNIVVRNKLAEICEKYLVKGDKVYIEGRIKNRQYEVDGQKRYTTEIQVQDMTFLSTKKDPNSNGTSPSPVSNQPNVDAKPKVDQSHNEDDDLPF
ncbi:single-stranded DNA-binding protein [Tenacibaculum sp. 190524A02b]|uniref:Single-stranded DNA-binding protein n=1 Tax=Tenacibaculum vairaonense TaxID=3137860 RepID=A0ABM9PJB2_9FLAO